MTISLRNSFDGPDGVAISVANSGGALGDPWSGLFLGGGQIIYSATGPVYGTAAARFTSAPSTLTFLSKAFGSAQTTTYVRLYMKLDGTQFNESRRIIVLNTGGTSGTLVAALRRRFDGKIDLEPAGVFNVAVSTTVLPATGWARIELKTVHSTTAGQMTCRIYTGSDPHTLTIAETLTTGATENTGASADALRIGAVTSITGANDTFWLDEFAVSYDDWPGPALIALQASVNMAALGSLSANATLTAGPTAVGRIHHALFTANAPAVVTAHDFYKLVGTAWEPCTQYVLRDGAWR